MLEWNETVETGIASIDSHNKEFYNHLNKFLIANTNAKGQHVVEDILIFLKQYATEHTAIQERYMKMHGYPHEEDHKSDHLHFRNYVEKWLNRHSEDGITSAMVLELQNHMGEWFVEHISIKDKRLAAHINRVTFVK
jgi:hemerythrin